MEATEFRPTVFDNSIAGFFDYDDPRRKWIVAPCSQNRDSDCLDQSNFAACLEILGGESETVEVHRFGHWGPGWFEVILIDPHSPQFDTLKDIERRLEDYPVLNEDDFSEREWKLANDTWRACYSLAERVEMCREEGISIFAARHAYIPQDDNGAIYERMITP